MRSLPVKEDIGTVELLDLTLRQHQNPVGSHHGIDPVGNGQHGLVSELLLNDLLDDVVSLEVDTGCGLINQNHSLGVEQ